MSSYMNYGRFVEIYKIQEYEHLYPYGQYVISDEYQDQSDNYVLINKETGEKVDVVQWFQDEFVMYPGEPCTIVHLLQFIPYAPYQVFRLSDETIIENMSVVEVMFHESMEYSRVPPDALETLQY
jgi:hypothetical protein